MSPKNPQEQNTAEAVQQKKASESLEEAKFDLGGYEDPYQYFKQFLRLTKTKNSDEIVREVLSQLTHEGQARLLNSLISHEARRFNKKVTAQPDMDEIKPDLKLGEYPYIHGYNRDLYNKQIRELQVELIKLQNWVQKHGKKIIIIFEGRDAAGKGGTILRFTEHLNPRGARIAALPKPSETELGQWYFQRYVAHLPTAGEIVFFDRSWYNRAVVEPVMGFCTKKQYETFMKEVPSFEKNLISSEIIIFKFWLNVSRKEQKRRFKQRRKDPLKQWKLSPVDLASLSKWDDYTKAIDNMFLATDTQDAPWTVIESDDKMRARINAIRVVLSKIDYAGKNTEVIGEIDRRIVCRANAFISAISEVKKLF